VALNRAKVLDTAQKHLSKGNHDRAIVELQRLLEAEPGDVYALLKLGEVYARKGSKLQAVRTYEQVAEHYVEQGFYRKAVPVYKQVLRIDPGRLETSLRLAQMYQELGFTNEALSTYEVVAAGHAREGRIEEALATLKLMSDLDPQNVAVRIKYAEALSKMGKKDEAAAQFEQGATLLAAQGRIDDYLKVAERLLFHRSGDLGLVRDLAERYLERNDPKRALAKLQVAFKANPRDIRTLELLARAFHVLGQITKTVSVYREISKIYAEANRVAERAQILRKILELVPDDTDSRAALAEIEGPEIVEDAEIDALDAEEGEVYVVDDDGDVSAEISVEMPEIEVIESLEGEPREESALTVEAHVARLLAECDVFARYGLANKVIAQLEEAIGLAPDHVEARERLKDAYLEAGRVEDAAAQLGALAEVFERSKPQLAQLYLRQAVEIDPGYASRALASEEPEPPSAELTAPAALIPDDVPPLMPEGLEADEADEQGVADEDLLFVDEEEEDEFLSHGAPAAPTPVGDRDAMLPAEAMPAADATPAAPWPEPALAPEPALLAEAPSPEEFVASPSEAALRRAEAEAAERASVPPGEIEETLDEVEFFMAQALWEEARDTLEDALESHPGHFILLDKMQELEEAEANAGGASGDESDESFALAEKLAEELDGEEVSNEGVEELDVGSVFSQFKRGIKEQIAPEDSETHFDLGIAYKEMGLFEDSIHEFGLAGQDPLRACMAETMIGFCFIQQANFREAIKHFKQGLYAEQKTPAEELGLYYELGQAYEQLGDSDEALYYYQKVFKRDADFRDVRIRVLHLQSPHPEGGEAAQSLEPSVADVDRAFDDLLGDE